MDKTSGRWTSANGSARPGGSSPNQIVLRPEGDMDETKRVHLHPLVVADRLRACPAN
jgi:hypothetical protein